MTGWSYKFKCNRAEEQRGLIGGYFPVFDTGAACSSFIYSCQSRVCKCRNKGNGDLEIEFGELK